MDTKNTSSKQYTLKLTTLSPLVINSGDVLSPLADYFVYKGRLYYTDSDKFQQMLAEDERFMQQYEEKVRVTSDEGADSFLNDLFAQAGKDLMDVSSGVSVPYTGAKTTAMSTIIKSSGLPYIPASSVKGAIKNAVLYYWLTVEKSPEFRNFLSQNYLEVRSIARRKLQDNRGGRKNDASSRDLRAAVSNMQTTINRFFSDAEEDAFGIQKKQTSVRQPASNLLIGDSAPGEITDIEAGSILKRTLASHTDWNAHIQEYIRPGVSYTFQLNINHTRQDWAAFPESGYFAQLLKDCFNNLERLLKVIDHFYHAVKEAYQSFKVPVPVWKKKSSGETLLFLGYGKGIFRNTILMAMKNYYDEQGWDFANDFAPLYFNKKEDALEFPNSVTLINDQPLGWVRIEDTSPNAYTPVEEPAYTEEQLLSGMPIAATVKKIGRPDYTVEVKMVGEESEQLQVRGAKHYLKRHAGGLQEGGPCTIYYRDNHFNFNQQV